MPALWSFAAVAVAWAVAASQAHAQDVALHVPSGCRTAAADFDARVRSALIARPASERAASVVIERRGERYRVTIQARDPDSTLGTKRLSTDSCDEAVAASVAVLALALSDTAAPVGAEGGGREDRRPAAVPELAVAKNDRDEPRAVSGGNGLAAVAASRSRVLAADRTQSTTRVAAPRADSRRLRHVHLALRAGVDAGTLSVPTGYVGAAATLLSGPLEWRALLGVGLPYQEHEIDGAHEELRREQFAWLDLGGCYGWGTAWRFAACAAGEVSLVHQSQRVDGRLEDATASRLSGLLAAHLAYREGRLQPELELAALAAPDGRRAAFRASFGLGMPF